MSVCRDMRRYKWTFWEAVVIDLWWRIEHLPYRGGEGGLCGPLKRYAYGHRKAGERCAYLKRTGHPA